MAQSSNLQPMLSPRRRKSFVDFTPILYRLQTDADDGARCETLFRERVEEFKAFNDPELLRDFLIGFNHSCYTYLATAHGLSLVYQCSEHDVQLHKLRNLNALIDYGFEILRSYRSPQSTLEEELSTIHPKVAKGVRYIHENISDELSLKQVATHCELNEAYFSTLFKEVMGVGFTHYIQGVRLELACRYLSETRASIDAISTRVGFRSAAYFATVFKQHYGLSPTAYRRQSEAQRQHP